MAKGGKRQGAGRPKLWTENSYPLHKTMLPILLSDTLLTAREKQIPVTKLIEAIQQAA